MGEAKRREAEIARLKEKEAIWRATLSDDERIVALLAERLDERLVRGRQFSEGCYHLAFFMTLYLSLRGIRVTPIIGWVNDGTWQGMTSHAWIELNGKKTDVSLTYTSYPDVQPTGSLIIHDHVLRKGMATYHYFKNDDPEVAIGLDWMRGIPEWRSTLAFKEAQHGDMMSIVTDDRINEYMSMAPPGGAYAELARIVE